MNTIIGMILVLGVLILVHEWGHFVAARFFGVRVDVFSIGFGPRLFGIKRGATDYRVSALPLGGYVRMAGQDITDIDSGDQKPTGAPDELMSKKRWQRAIICFAGPIVNLIFPIFLLTGYFALKGEPLPKYEKEPLVIADLQKDSPLAKAGVVVGDRIVSLNGIANPTWETAQNLMDKAPDGQSYQIIVANQQGEQRPVEVNSTGMKSPDLIFGFPEGSSAVVDGLNDSMPNNPARAAGVKPGDTILSVDGRKVGSAAAFVDAVQSANGKPVSVVIRRGGQLLNLSITPQKGTNPGEPPWMVGIVVGPGNPDVYYRPVSFTNAYHLASGVTWRATGMVMDVVGRLISGKTSPKELQSIVGISAMAGKAVQAGSFAVVQLMAALSVNLGILNLLPIPILDGGQIFLLSLEGIRRRDFSLTFKERFIQVGLVFLLALIAYVTYNDVARMLVHHS